ncbi:MAG: hypothetical protein NWR72_12520, partial [Bacteroidia bacterium]|nr:hypothetical protein [Bacteroidia bacterium]
LLIDRSLTLKGLRLIAETNLPSHFEEGS